MFTHFLSQKQNSPRLRLHIAVITAVLVTQLTAWAPPAGAEAKPASDVAAETTASAPTDTVPRPGQTKENRTKDNTEWLLHDALSNYNPIPDKREEKKILACFDRYRKAVAKRRGRLATKYVDSSVYASSEMLLRKALSANADELLNGSVSDAIIVQILRAQIPRDKLARMTGKSVFVHLVSRGLLESEVLSSATLADVMIFKGRATAKQYRGGKPVGIIVRFSKEKGRWRFDADALMRFSTLAFEKGAPKNQDARIKLIETAVAAAMGKPHEPALWGLSENVFSAAK